MDSSNPPKVPEVPHVRIEYTDLKGHKQSVLVTERSANEYVWMYKLIGCTNVTIVK